MKIIKNWIPVLAIMLIIFWFSNQEGNESAVMSTNFSNIFINNFVSNIKLFEDNLDFIYGFFRKLAHFIIFMFLGISVINALSNTSSLKKNNIKFAFFICFFYASFDEIHQMMIPGRSGQIEDVLLDSVGSIFGIFLYFMISKLFFKIKYIFLQPK